MGRGGVVVKRQESVRLLCGHSHGEQTTIPNRPRRRPYKYRDPVERHSIIPVCFFQFSIFFFYYFPLKGSCTGRVRKRYPK